jgi:hypothetical protein
VWHTYIHTHTHTHGPARRTDGREQDRDELVIRGLHHDEQILLQRVLVLVEEAGGVVGHVSGIVLDDELDLHQCGE